MRVRNVFEGIIHNATKLCDIGLGTRYQLSCGGEVYVGMFKGKYATTHHAATCKKCLRKEGK